MSSSEVLRAAISKAKFGPAEIAWPIARHQLHPSRRPLQEPNRAGQHRAQTRQDRHERLPAANPCRGRSGSHDTIFRSGGRHSPLVHEIVGHDLLEIGEDIVVRDRDSGGRAGGTGGVLQIRRRDRSSPVGRDGLEDRGRASRSSKSTSTIAGVLGPGCASTVSLTSGDGRRRRQNDRG